MKGFSPQERAQLREQLFAEGFALLKQGGLRGLNLDELVRRCYIAKGTFYLFFPSKSEFLYQLALHERARAKAELLRYLNPQGTLSAEGLACYLLWLCRENPNVFAYMTPAEQQRLCRSWPGEYLENEANDESTMGMLLARLEHPRPDPDWKTACNILKMTAAALAAPQLLIEDALDATLHRLIRCAVECIAQPPEGNPV